MSRQPKEQSIESKQEKIVEGVVARNDEASGAELVFKSTFGEGTQIVQHTAKSFEIEAETISGLDRTTGYDWGELDKQLDDFAFQYVCGKEGYPGLVNSRIVDGVGPDGGAALLMEVVNDYSGRTEHKTHPMPIHFC